MLESRVPAEVRRERAAVGLQLVRQLGTADRQVERRAGADDLILPDRPACARIYSAMISHGLEIEMMIPSKPDFSMSGRKFIRRRDAAILMLKAGLSQQTRLAGCIDHDVCILHVIDRTR